MGLMALWRLSLGRIPPQGRFVALFFALLALPALLQLVGPRTVGLGPENRQPAPPPSWPRTIADLPKLPQAADAYLADRFGLRGPLVRLNTALRWRVLGELGSPLLLVGQHGRIFQSAFNGFPPNSLITTVCGATATEPMIAQATETVRRSIQVAQDAGLEPTLLLVPTAARLHPEDLPPAFAARCAGHVPLGDAVAARVTDLPVIYPAADMMRWGGIPRHRFHWAGDVPVRVAERVAEQHWGLSRSFPVPFLRKTRGSDFDGISPGLGLTDPVDEPQLHAVDVWDCWYGTCQITGLQTDAVRPLRSYRRPGKGRLLIISDSFGEEIAPDFLQFFAEVWLVNTNLSRTMSPAARAVLAGWVDRYFRPGRVLLVFHDFGTTLGFDQSVADVLRAH